MRGSTHRPGAEQLWRTQEGTHGDGQTEAWPRGQRWMVHHAGAGCAGSPRSAAVPPRTAGRSPRRCRQTALPGRWGRRESGVSLQTLDGRRGRFLQVAAFRGQKCTATALSTWGMPAYPLATPPSRVVRTEEADERLLAVKGAIHELVSSSCISGKKGTGAGRGCEPRNQVC